MAAVTSERFRGLLASLDAGELADLVADVWSARGWETRVEGETVTATGGPLGDTRRLACVSPDRLGRASLPDEDADVVVATRASGNVRAEADARGVRFLGPDGLRDVLLYAIDREAAERLFASHFGRPLAVERSGGMLDGRLPAGMPWRALGAGVLLVLLAGVVLAGAGGGGAPFADGGATPTTPETTAPAATESPGNEVDGNRTNGGDGVPSDQYPPGIGPGGVADADALATAHGQSLVQTTYDLLIVHRGSEDILVSDREWASSRQTVARISETRYWYRFAGAELTENGSYREVVFDDFADGTYDYRRSARPGPPEYRRGLIPTGGGNGLFTAVAEAYIRRYLSTDRGRVELITRDGETMFRVVATGTPHRIRGSVSGYRAVALVDWVGRVHRLSVTYDRPDAGPDASTSAAGSASGPGAPNGTVEFELVYRDMGGTILGRPPWYDEARNATNETAIDLWPVDRRWWSQPIGIDYGEDR